MTFWPNSGMMEQECDLAGGDMVEHFTPSGLLLMKSVTSDIPAIYWYTVFSRKSRVKNAGVKIVGRFPAIAVIAKYQAKIHEEIPKCHTEERALVLHIQWVMYLWGQ